MDLAFFRLPNGTAWLGVGPFVESNTPPESGVAFYINNFALDGTSPWKVPAKCVPVADDAALASALGSISQPRIIWHKPDPEWFKTAFRRIRRDVLAQRVRKMVPVLAEKGHIESGDPAAVLSRAFQAPAGFWSYGRVTGDSGFVGATPELLLHLNGSRLETMALAGTARPHDMDGFATDPKEIDEHEIVAAFLEKSLSPLGPVSRSAREIREAAGLTHFRTQISVELKNGARDLNALVRLLHPTPAVGCVPRDEQSLGKLMEYRRLLEVPSFFGAPFGFKSGGEFHCVVAIRGIGWTGSEAVLPSGCGIVAGSAYDHEWRELRLKREAVARLLGV